MSESNVELARRGFAAALRGDPERIGELLDPAVRWHGGDPPPPGACHNRDEALAFLRQSDVIRGGRFELVDVVGAGDRVVIVMRPPSDSGDPAPAVATVATFREGRVIELMRFRTPTTRSPRPERDGRAAPSAPRRSRRYRPGCAGRRQPSTVAG